MTDFDAMSAQDRKSLLLKLLNDTQQAIAEETGQSGSFDIHHPERSPSWKPYRHQEWPKMLYHPVKLDEAIETQRRGIELRNGSNPNLAPLPIPPSQPMRIKVNNQDEFDIAEAEGFVPFAKIQQPKELAVSDPLANEETAAQFVGGGRGKRK